MEGVEPDSLLLAPGADAASVRAAVPRVLRVARRGLEAAASVVDPVVNACEAELHPDCTGIGVHPQTYSRARGARSGETRICARHGCEIEFYVQPARLNGLQRKIFCSRACKGIASRKPNSEETRRRKKEAALRLAADPQERERRRARMVAKNRTGARNPNYKNGKWTGKQDRELGRLFNLKRKGESACRVCGTTENVHMHHAIPKPKGTRESRLNILNGIPLCGSHHSKWHRGVRCVRREHFTDDEWSYLLSVPMLGRVTRSWLEDHYPVAVDL